MDLDEVLARVNSLPEDERAALKQQVLDRTAGRKFIPSPGPQTDAWYSKADVLLYGGQGGAGKTGLLCGLALEEHRQSLLMRRHGTDMEGAGGVIEELLKIYGSREGFSGKPPATLRTEDDRMITFASAPHLGDERKYMGRARDLLGLDEATQFLEQQVRFLMGWVRTTIEGQRTRTVLATNPPLDNTGDWVIGMFRPWLDTTHPDPAEYGELRWFVTVKDSGGSKDLEVDGPGVVEINGETLDAMSRTFIPGSMTDNPFIQTTEYRRQLDSMPEPYRSAIRDGNFMASRSDDKRQVIPTQWIREAQARWTPEPPEHAPMSAIAADVAQGGEDSTAIATRYDSWFGEIEKVPGSETPTGNEVAGLIISRRRNNAAVIVDAGGGYGGAAIMRLKDNNIEVKAYKGSEGTRRRTCDNLLGFYNTRSMAYWRLREELDPGQDGGATIALPDDPELVSDLTAPRYEITSRGIQITPKEKLVADLGRSPDKGDALVMANLHGPRLLTHGNEWRKYREPGLGGSKVKVVQSHQAARRRR